MARLALGSIVLFSAVTLVISCSSGLGRNPERAPTPAAVLNPNRVTGIDLGVTPTDAAAQPVAAGAVVPAIGSTAARDVMLVAFTSSSAANDADGSGNALSRDAVTDTNGANDVFVAAISAQDIETRAFSQSLAGKFRHPRCTTCHSMQSSDSLAFVSSTQPHAGPLPGASFPNNSPSICAQCHGSSQFTAKPIPLWQAPATSFDFRRKTVAQLADAANDAPTGDISHFRDDPRVLWALDSGRTPTFGGRNGIADDDHDGVLEPEDTDGVPKPVPGGAAVFLREIEDYIASGRVVTNARAVKDVTLASRANGTTAASNGASTTPRVLWVANGSFDPTNSTTARNTNPVGTLYVAFASTGSDIAGTDANSASDVFRATVELRAEEAADGSALTGGLNLVYLDGSTVLCSAIDGGTTSGTGASTQPSIGGATADTVAFTSLATDLIAAFTNGNGSGADVFVRKIGTQVTTLVSHSLSSTSATGDGASEKPAVDATGVVVAFESEATNLRAGDTNALRDVYYADVSGSTPFTKLRASVSVAGAQATGGASSAASVHVSGSRVRVAFQSDATNLDTGLVATTNVYLFDSALAGGTSSLLNRRRTLDANVIGDGSARAPVISTDGEQVAFESDASNIDSIRTTDINHATDIFLVRTAQLAERVVAPSRISVTAREGADGNGASTAPWFGSFGSGTSFSVGFVTYTTAATNLGTSDTTPLMVGFLTEANTVVKGAPTASFTAAATDGVTPSVTFTDTSTQLPTSWLWDFGDGTTSTEQNPVHVYATAGAFTVELTVTNSVGTSTVSSDNLPVIAAFTASTTSGAAPLTINLTNTTVGATSYSWDFGDGTTATTTNASKTYSTGGTFTITLTATGTGGTDTATTDVTISSSASFSITGSVGSFPSAYESTSVTFTSTSSGGPTSFTWDFDSVANPGALTASGSTVTRSFPNVTTSTRDYVVRLTVDGPGGQAQTTRTLRIVSDTETTTLGPNADNTIYQDATNNSNGAGTDIYVGRTLGTGGTLARRGLLRFNLPASGTVPANSTITAATVSLTFSQALNTGSQTIGFHRVTSNWTEGTTNGGAQGAAALSGGGATWANRITPGTAWTTAGGDFNPSATSTLIAGAGLSGSGTTGSLVTDVQAWVNGTSNFGWLLQGNEAVVQTVKKFASREGSAGTPVLSVTFTRPLP